ncbi:class I SAM-dependent methyltransferase [Sphaerospermopsis sp. FACHB-1094]|uniref:TylF/MycF/NovP-related O-methyltransferase n=1 Tax=Sphaerospermopsis sp. FACHB-1094 TaxID=2692861 RepID=UPI001685FA77|nr:TylF/MycF/NovP-related O-methyltransferase [Sphaerospermopsis sp. FACHB-1094]MBD2133993.1 class I SAM-dependent methyltransferase [Sphaerospermopsis sp. FACHB-1094]
MTIKKIKNFAKKQLLRGINKFGLDIVKYQDPNILQFPVDFDPCTISICNKVKPYTMTSVERLNALIKATEYIISNEIDGDMVECGVWKGGSAMAMALKMKEMGSIYKKIHLYDTFEGMSSPTGFDKTFDGGDAIKKFSQTKITDSSSNWCYSPLGTVTENCYSTGYPTDKFVFVKGKVEDTLPLNLPSSISLLRLDTDWYESTKKELEYLFPLLSPNGILIIDDYGHWQGARKAVDEYFKSKNIHILLNRIDYTGRLAIKNDCSRLATPRKT